MTLMHQERRNKRVGGYLWCFEGGWYFWPTPPLWCLRAIMASCTVAIYFTVLSLSPAAAAAAAAAWLQPDQPISNSLNIYGILCFDSNIFPHTHSVSESWPIDEKLCVLSLCNVCNISLNVLSPVKKLFSGFLLWEDHINLVHGYALLRVRVLLQIAIVCEYDWHNPSHFFHS